MKEKEEEGRRKEKEEGRRRKKKDGDGLISKREVREVYRKLGETISDEVLTEMLNQVDLNQDGQISFEEFIAFRQQTNFKIL